MVKERQRERERERERGGERPLLAGNDPAPEGWDGLGLVQVRGKGDVFELKPKVGERVADLVSPGMVDDDTWQNKRDKVSAQKVKRGGEERDLSVLSPYLARDARSVEAVGACWRGDRS